MSGAAVPEAVVVLSSGTRSAVRGPRSTDEGDDDVCCLFTITTGITGGSGGSPLKEGRVDDVL